MKHQSYIRSLFVALAMCLVGIPAMAEEASTTAENAVVHLNPFAFKLSRTLTGDVLNVTYYLNAPATNVEVSVDINKDGKIDGNDVVYNCNNVKNTQGTTVVKGIYTANISLREKINDVADFRNQDELPWYVDVKGGNTATWPAVGAGAELDAQEVTSQSYNFYSPWSVDVDIDPYSDNFGTIYAVERIDGVANSMSAAGSAARAKYFEFKAKANDKKNYTEEQRKNFEATANQYLAEAVAADASAGYDDYFGWLDGVGYKGGLYSFDPAFQNYPTMYDQTTEGGGTAYDFVNYDVSKVKAIRRDASMNANSSGHQGGAFTKNDLFGRVRIAYKPDHNNRVFLSFSPEQQTSGSTSILLGEVKANNYPLIGRAGKGNTDWFTTIMSANTYVAQVTNSAGDVTQVGKLGYYNGNDFVAGPNIVFDASVDGDLLRLCMISGAYKDRDITHRDSYRCDEYAIGLTATSITAPHKEKIFNMRRTESPDDVNFWYFNSRKLVPSCMGNIGGVKAHTGNGTCKYCAGADAVGFSNTYAHRGLEYDPDGKGFWHAQVRDNHNEIPSLVHFRYNETTRLYEVNFAEYICGRGGAAVRYDINGDRLAVAGGRFTTKTYTVASTTTDAHRTKNVWPNDITDNFPKPAVEIDWATIYTVNKANLHADMIDNYDDNTKADYKETSVANRAKVFTDSVLINVGCRMYDFAWDYADNLYICATGSHKFFALALPHAGKTVSTPCKDTYRFNTNASQLTVNIYPQNVNCGTVVDYEFQKSFAWYMNGATYKLEAKPADGYRFVSWYRTNSQHQTVFANYHTKAAKAETIEADFGINVHEDAKIVDINSNTDFKAVYVKRELDAESYSTICLPFNLPTLTGTPYAGASVLKFVGEVASNEDGDNRIFLNFEEVTFNGNDIMEAGKPYLIKVANAVSGENMFWNVTCPDIDNQGQSVTKGDVTFHALLNPTTFTKDQVKDKLFLTADNRLVSLYGQNSFSINGLRGFFTVKEGAKNVEYMLNLPEKVVTSTPMVNMADTLQVTKYLWDGKIYIQKGNQVYDLSGARVK